MKTEIKVGDVVEVQNPSDPTWDGIQFRITKLSNKTWEGTVTKGILYHRFGWYPVENKFTWHSSVGLVVVDQPDDPVEPKNEQPTKNQAYIDHIYERLTQNVTPEELISLAERLDRAGKGISLRRT